LLIGKTLNTNSHWLAKRIASLGLLVDRITVVGDNVSKIAEVLKATLQRYPDFIITTGGLGPTFDDMTLNGIAESLNTPLQLNQVALKMIQKTYQQITSELGSDGLELTPAREKMAIIPRDAAPLPNPVGTAPAVTIKRGTVTIFVLPGVPQEMKAIFDDSLVEPLKQAVSDRVFFEASLHVSGVMESKMAPLIKEVMQENPLVYIKSHPKGSESNPVLELHLSTTAKNVATAKQLVRKVLVQLSAVVETAGGTTEPEPAHSTRS
jgi:molybdenum cofactor synthesis domain-containing protein